VDVPIETSALVITFNQPMSTGGGGNRSITSDHYTLINKSTNTKLTILERTYNPLTYTVTVTFDNTGVAWRYLTLYEVQMDNQVTNACGTRSQALTSSFTTEPLTPVTPVPADSVRQENVSLVSIILDFVRAMLGSVRVAIDE
jgi:hypothetical protein